VPNDFPDDDIPDDIVIQTAIHEHFRGRFDAADPVAKACVERLHQYGRVIVRAADLLDTAKLDLLADWLDAHDAQKAGVRSREVQADPPEWARTIPALRDRARPATVTPEELGPLNARPTPADTRIAHVRDLCDILTGIRENIALLHGETAARPLQAFERTLRRVVDEKEPSRV
jgi:hypothetical protein